MSIVFSLLVFAFSLSAVIIIHELGHFIMARRAGILCHEFALGMGPVIWKKKIGETVYLVKAIPIGGYVAMAGEEMSDEIVKIDSKVRLEFEGELVSKIILDHNDERYQNALCIDVEKVDLKGEGMTRLYINEYEVKRDAFYVIKKKEYQIAPFERGFDGKTKSQRFWAIFAGPAMNFILAFFIFLLLNFIVGFPNMDTPTLGVVSEGSPAGYVLEVGDEILSVEGEPVDSWTDLSETLSADYTNRNITLVVQRGNQVFEVDIIPTLYFFSVGLHSEEDADVDVIIGDITEGSLAANAVGTDFETVIGFEQGDEIIKIGNTDITTWADFINEIDRLGSYTLIDDNKTVNLNAGYIYEDETFYLPFVVLRDGREVTLNIAEPFSTAFLETQGIGIVDSRIGIGPEYEFRFFSSFSESVKNVGSSAGIIFTTIGLLINSDGAGAGIGIDNLAGPVGIYTITASALEQGFTSLLSWIGLLSVNLAVINLLPIPALDGGRLVFLGYEAVSRRKPNKKFENTFHYIFFLALMGLFVFIFFNDIGRLIGF